MLSPRGFQWLGLGLVAIVAIAWMACPEQPAGRIEQAMSIPEDDLNSDDTPRISGAVEVPPTPIEASREAVEMVRRLGGTALIASDGNVMVINLTGCSLREGDLAHLATTPELTLLNLDNTNVGDDELKFIRDLPRLRILRLCRTGITNSGLQYLENLPALATLQLDDTLVTDDGMKHLGGLSSLTRINVMGCSVTYRAQEIIHSQLPNCRIKPRGLSR